MFRRRQKREVPELNATSTADISFMLLTFFLVTTSMDVDKGIVRRLPPMDDSAHIQPTEVPRENLLEIEITHDDKYLVNGQPLDLTAIESEVVRFVSMKGGDYMVSVVSDPNSSYNAYFLLQNGLSLAYKRIRDNYARKKYGKNFAKCTETQRDDVRRACPLHLAEPQKITEN